MVQRWTRFHFKNNGTLFTFVSACCRINASATVWRPNLRTSFLYVVQRTSMIRLKAMFVGCASIMLTMSALSLLRFNPWIHRLLWCSPDSEKRSCPKCFGLFVVTCPASGDEKTLDLRPVCVGSRCRFWPKDVAIVFLIRAEYKSRFKRYK